jgi:hypothetical protein
MEPIADITIKNAVAYAGRYELRLGERLGFSIHGSVRVVEQKIKSDISAIKSHRDTEFYLRERAVHERLSGAGSATSWGSTFRRSSVPMMNCR